MSTDPHTHPVSQEPPRIIESAREKPAQAEAPLGAPQVTATFKTLRHFLFVVFINALVLIELCIGMYRAAQVPDEFTPVFFKTFFALLAPTLVLAAVGKRFVNLKAAKS